MSQEKSEFMLDIEELNKDIEDYKNTMKEYEDLMKEHQKDLSLPNRWDYFFKDV
jgi:hypothetical protein